MQCAAREAREAASHGDDYAAAPSADERRNAALKRNLFADGGGGMFQIPSQSSTEATLRFRGFDSSWGSTKNLDYEIIAHDGESVQQAVVEKMIEVIRTRYKGNFQWERRNGAVVTKSAAKKDTADLTAFLKREMFGV